MRYIIPAALYICTAKRYIPRQDERIHDEEFADLALISRIIYRFQQIVVIKAQTSAIWTV